MSFPWIFSTTSSGGIVNIIAANVDMAKTIQKTFGV
jgi:hypothetical protein